jgi:hypothetical protein
MTLFRPPTFGFQVRERCLRSAIGVRALDGVWCTPGAALDGGRQRGTAISPVQGMRSLRGLTAWPCCRLKTMKKAAEAAFGGILLTSDRRQ